MSYNSHFHWKEEARATCQKKSWIIWSTMNEKCFTYHVVRDNSLRRKNMLKNRFILLLLFFQNLTREIEICVRLSSNFLVWIKSALVKMINDQFYIGIQFDTFLCDKQKKIANVIRVVYGFCMVFLLFLQFIVIFYLYSVTFKAENHPLVLKISPFLLDVNLGVCLSWMSISI